MKLLYPKYQTSIECANINNQGYHFWLSIDHSVPIKVINLQHHEITFEYQSVTYIYWADMSMFLKRFYTTSEVRELKLNELLG